MAKQFMSLDVPTAILIAKDALKQKPATFYHGAITDELPTGDMIQRRDFRDQNGQRPKPAKFDFAPFR